MVGLEDESITIPRLDQPRASLIAAPGAVEGLRTAIWMGGARSYQGELIDDAALARSVVIDCAGELPVSYRTAAASWQPCVFVDHDGPNAAIERVRTVANQAAGLANAGELNAIYVMCTHGMNRSGLVTGLILRELGMSGAEAVEVITKARRGALSNQWFRSLLHNG